ARQPDGKLLVTSGSTLLRLNADGSGDPAFNVVRLAGDEDSHPFLRTVVLQPDGKMLIGGFFLGVSSLTNSEGRPGLARLNGDGRLDTGFRPEVNTYYGIGAIAVQSDGKVIAGGSDVISQVSTGFVRLLPNGHLDTNFSLRVDMGFGYGVAALALQPDGKILI